MGLGVAGDKRAGIVDVGYLARWRDDADRTEAAGVLGNSGIGHMEHAIVDRASRHAERTVDGASRLVRAPRIVGHKLVTLDVEVDGDGIGDGLDAVVLDHIREAVLAVGEQLEFGAHPALRIVHEVFASLAEERSTVLLDDLGDAGNAEIHAADHRPEVAIVLARGAAVGEQKLPDLVDVLACLLDLDGRNPQPLVKDLGGLATEGTRHHAADLGDVADAHGKSQKLAIHEERLEEGVLGAVQTPTIGVVVQDNIARLE